MDRSIAVLARVVDLAPRADAPAPDEEQIQEATAGFDPTTLLPASIILASAVVIGLVVRRVLERILRSRTDNTIVARLIARTTGTLIVVVGLFYALSDLGIRVGLLMGALGIGGFVLAFAFKDTLENLISGVVIQIRQPFDYSDLVSLGEYQGRVDDVDLRAVTMTTFSGERVIIPSADVLNAPIENWTAHPTRRIEIDVAVAYGSDVERACEVVTAAVAEAEHVLSEPPPQTVFDGFGASSIDLTAHLWFPSDGPYFDVRRDAAGRIQRALGEHGIDIPFPTRTLHVPDDLSVSTRSAADDDRGSRAA